MGEDFSFVSNDAAIELKKYLESLVKETINVDIIDDSSLDEEIPSTFKIEYNSQILHKEAFLNGQKVKIINTFYEKWEVFHTVKIELPNGKQCEVDCRELDFEYNK